MLITASEISSESLRALIRDIAGEDLANKFSDLCQSVSVDDSGRIIVSRRFGILGYSARLDVLAQDGALMLEVNSATLGGLSWFGYVKSKTIKELGKFGREFKAIPGLRLIPTNEGVAVMFNHVSFDLLIITRTGFLLSAKLS